MNLKRILRTMSATAITVMASAGVALAAETIQNIVGNGNANIGNIANSVQTSGNVRALADNILGPLFYILAAVGALAAVGGFIVAGVSFSMSAHNPQKRVLAWGSLAAAAVGAILVFGAFKLAGYSAGVVN